MKRRERTQILIESSPRLAQELASEILGKYQLKVLEEPSHGLTMVKVRESAKKQVFYLGEVLVTEAKVMLEGALGLGIVQGNHSELAYHLAIIDAAYEAQVKETILWEERLIKAAEAIREMRCQQRAALMATKVQFETMSV
ncbi:MAG: phosphonate C-P lyase system protein PhnG [Cellulosilyticaceae bacterium]